MALQPLTLIVSNPDLSGRTLKAMVLVRDPDGSFRTHPSDFPDVMLGDGQTTLIHVPLGARIVIGEATDPPMAAEIAEHPAVAGKPAAKGKAEAAA